MRRFVLVLFCVLLLLVACFKKAYRPNGHPERDAPAVLVSNAR